MPSRAYAAPSAAASGAMCRSPRRRRLCRHQQRQQRRHLRSLHGSIHRRPPHRPHRLRRLSRPHRLRHRRRLRHQFGTLRLHRRLSRLRRRLRHQVGTLTGRRASLGAERRVGARTAIATHLSRACRLMRCSIRIHIRPTVAIGSAPLVSRSLRPTVRTASTASARLSRRITITIRHSRMRAAGAMRGTVGTTAH